MQCRQLRNKKSKIPIQLDIEEFHAVINDIVTMCSIMMHTVIKYDKLIILMRLYSNIILDVIIRLKLLIYYTYITHHIQKRHS